MDANGNGRVRFGEYELDSQSGRLLRDGRPVKIQPQPLRVLGVLVQRPGEIVTREELHSRIWDEATFVEFDQGLNYCIRQIRLALRDDASKPVYIETLPKQGYRFIAPITANGHASDSVLTAAETKVDQIPPSSPVTPVAPPPSKQIPWKILGTAIAVMVLAAAGIALGVMRRPAANQPLIYTQITSFTDAVVWPTLSPDGRMVAFYRGGLTMFTADQIYVKMLPNGEPVQLTHDPRQKYNLAFSPDGSQIAYTVMEKGWHTYTVSVLGGDSKLFLPNAAGLSWLDQHHLLFSEFKTGVHLGIVTAGEDRSEHREIYFPAEERMMAHYSYLSPDRKWVLLAEMNPQWQPCRLVPFSGDSSSGSSSGTSGGRQVGPPGSCTSTAWSPDGNWMYFAVAVNGKRHLWRQRFPDGQPEQITSGLTEEDGLAVAPDGRSLITSMSTKQNAVWIHDLSGDRALSTEGYADLTPPRFSMDGKRLYYLLRRDSPEAPDELWRADLDSGSSEVVVPGGSMREYDISDDEKEVVFTTQTAGQSTELWLAPLDRSAPPRRIGDTGEVEPHFGPDGRVVFRLTEGNTFYLAGMGRDGSGRAKIFPSPILDILGISRDRRFAILGVPAATPAGGQEIAVPIEGGPARKVWLCDFGCRQKWSPDGGYYYVPVAPPSQKNPTGKTLVIPVPPGESLPRWPASGIRSEAEALAMPGVRAIPQASIGPGLGTTYAYVKPTMHANLFRIPLRK
jgi:DNA-binding winged helix-turn-helix (wHTH) protein/Tol biopolymer transport system component